MDYATNEKFKAVLAARDIEVTAVEVIGNWRHYKIKGHSFKLPMTLSPELCIAIARGQQESVKSPNV